MKLCPQCEFIYEDEQSLCDMDGSVLVHTPNPVALEGNATPALSQRQQNPWAAESLSVSGTVQQPVISKAKFEVKSEKKPDGMFEWRRVALIAAAVVLGVLVFVVYYISSRQHSSQDQTQNSNVGTPSTLTASPAPPAASDPAAAVSPSAEELAQKASEAAANVSDAPEESADQAKTTNTSVSSSHSRNLKAPSASPESSESPNRELAANKSKPENITPTKGASAGKPEPGIAPKEPATAKPAAPVAQSQPKVVKPADPKAKKDSKVGSFFKKTGRILKKPFKL